MIGVAIPCYEKHFNLLPSLIENISKSTVRPDKIAVSCSSWTHDRRTDTTYDGIPVSIQYSKKVLNQATNRNIAGSMLNTLLISFIDADDLMHPSRLEYVIRAFKEGPYHAIYHSYAHAPITSYSDPFEPVGEYDLVSEHIISNPNTAGLLVENTAHPIHHAHVTVRRDVFNRFKFDERWDVYRIEDSLYGKTLAENGISLGYLANKLTRYIFTPS
jgi:hypothetical protein